jgi:hypothetical protein
MQNQPPHIIAAALMSAVAFFAVFFIFITPLIILLDVKIYHRE